MKSKLAKTLPEFKRYTIVLDHYSLRNGEDEIFMEPRLIRLLDVLYRNANEVVKKKDIMESVWQNVVVNEESVPRAILDLRRILNSQFANPPEIQTIRKVGYRLVLNEPKEPNRIKRSLQVVLKMMLILLGIVAFLIMLVRAINY